MPAVWVSENGMEMRIAVDLVAGKSLKHKEMRHTEAQRGSHDKQQVTQFLHDPCHAGTNPDTVITIPMPNETYDAIAKCRLSPNPGV